jgi:ABC-type nitrate/sulfonate/bicarbonate transport system substrate-binding protein
MDRVFDAEILTRQVNKRQHENRARPCLSLALVVIVLCGFLSFVHAETLTPVHIGVPTNSATWFPLYVGWKTGIFRDLGLELLPVYMQARTSLAALASQQIGYITQIGSPMTAIAGGLPAKLIMVLCVRSHHVLVVQPEITSPTQLRHRVVAISRPGGTVHRELLLILENSKIDPTEVKVVGLGSTPNGIAALKNHTVDAAMLSIPYDLYLEKEGYRSLVYVKDVLEFPLAGIVTNDNWIRKRPDEIRKVLLGALRGIRYTKTHEETVVPLLKEFLALDTLDTAKKAYERLKDIWPDNGVPSEKGLRTAATLAEVPNTFPLNKLADWSFVNEARSTLQAK